MTTLENIIKSLKDCVKDQDEAGIMQIKSSHSENILVQELADSKLAEIKRTREHQDLQAEIAERDERIKEHEAEIAERDKRIKERDERIDQWSLVGALSFNDDVKFVNDGNPDYRAKSRHEAAKIIETHFSFHRLEVSETKTCLDITSNRQSTLHDELKEHPRESRFDLPHDKRFTNEAEVQQMVHKVLTDSVNIINTIFGFEITGEKRLFVRKETRLLTNIPDHCAVYMPDKNFPILTVEDKYMDENTMTEPRVAGQALDQLVESILTTMNGNAYGAITMLKCTRAVWIGEDAEKWATSNDIMSEKRLLEARELLVNEDPSTTPPARRNIESASGPDLPKVGKAERKRRKISSNMKREINVSQTFYTKDLIHLFCNLIVAGILLRRSDQIITINKGNSFQADCCLTFSSKKTSLFLDEVNASLAGAATKPRGMILRRERKYHIVQVLGNGSTSKVFRAITPSGHDCVVKVYALQFDEKGDEIEGFETNAKVAMDREKKNYIKLYPGLGKYVWLEKLCDRVCLILPFFAPIQDGDRMEVEEDVRNAYKMFKKEQLYYKKRHVKWRHVGRFMDELYLFGLGGLVGGDDNNVCKDEDDTKVEAEDECWRLLLGRMQSTQIEEDEVGDEVEGPEVEIGDEEEAKVEIGAEAKVEIEDYGSEDDSLNYAIARN